MIMLTNSDVKSQHQYYIKTFRVSKTYNIGISKNSNKDMAL
jgi:hypothetical protein